MGVQLKKGKGNFLYNAVSIPQKMCQLKKYHPVICAVGLHLLHRESSVTTKQGEKIENKGISISLEQ